MVAVLVVFVTDFKVMVAVQTTLVAKFDMVPVIGTEELAANVELDTVEPSESFFI